MRIAIASDHAGRTLRGTIRSHLEARGHEVADLGTAGDGPVDYPDYALEASRRVAAGEADRGVLVCGTGIGMSIAANKVPGIRAVAPWNEATTRMSRLHNDANVICFGERVQDAGEVLRLLDLWLATGFEGGRHERRIEKIRRIESDAAAEITRLRDA